MKFFENYGSNKIVQTILKHLSNGKLERIDLLKNELLQIAENEL